jgi:hypothetical protein
MAMVGVLHNLCTGMSITWDSSFKLASRENGRMHDEESTDQPHFTWAQVTAQPNSQIQSQPSLHDFDLVKTTALKCQQTAWLSP